MEEMKFHLATPYRAEEVVLTLKQMQPNKVPGPDGLDPIFFQNIWPIVWGDVTSAALKDLNTGMFSDSLNHTYITLIPKKKNLEVAFDYRPLCLCNVLYKIMAKIYANKLKIILSQLIKYPNCFCT